MMISIRSVRRPAITAGVLLVWQLGQMMTYANPTGGTVTQGAATFSSSGSQMTIQAANQTRINWQSFNVGAGETTTFVQPSSSSIVWNQIGGGSPSQILGTINANGYVVLQNSAGFYVGGQASITAHGLVMSTAPIAMPSLTGGGAWQFNTPPPTAKIINYGQINIQGGNPAFLIANDIENHGTISAPGGKIGLYAGAQVLVSTSPDGRGLSASVTLPQGSVDNDGHLIADGGNIALQAKVVNQGGLVQANSVRAVNGTIELLASDAVNLDANSTISAQGDSSGISSGGTITIKSDHTYSDQVGSSINIAGGTRGGNGGQVEISATSISSIQSTINGQAASGFINGELTIDPYDIQLVSSGGTGTSDEYSSGTVNTSDSPTDGTLVLNVNNFSPTLSQINLQATHNIELSTVWKLADAGVPATMSLSAGNSIILDDKSAIVAGNNWSISLNAGTGFVPTTSKPTPDSGSYGIYLNGNAYVQTQNGNINAWAANELIVNGGALRTLAGGNIGVMAEYGDVNTGYNLNGYNFAPALSTRNNAPPYYTVSPNLGGISTAAGGNVTIKAGGNVTSYLPNINDITQFDPGTGAFGSLPGNVTINAGGNVSGNYVLANGIGSITAGKDLGVPLNSQSQDQGFILSLISGGWKVYAPNGNIYLADVFNPNGVFNRSTKSGYTGSYRFDYSQTASLLLNAGNSVEITGGNGTLPLAVDGDTLPILFPPILDVTTGAGGLVLDTSVILFPSANQSLHITTLNNGNMEGLANSASPINLEMSSSDHVQWSANDGTFGTADQGSVPLTSIDSTKTTDPNPVTLSVSGSIENINLYTTKETQITVGHDMTDVGFAGQNLYAGDTTFITAVGSIKNSPLYSFVTLPAGIKSANPLQPNAWDSIFTLAVNPDKAAALANLNINDATIASAITAAGGLIPYLQRNNYLLFPGASTSQLGSNPGFVYDSSSLQLGFKGNMSSGQAGGLTSDQITDLENGAFTVFVVNANGTPVVNANGTLKTTSYTFNAAAGIAGANGLAAQSLLVSPNALTQPQMGYQIGGPGQFDITASSVDLGNSSGILSFGFGNAANFQGIDYSALEKVIAPLEKASGKVAAAGAAINVTVHGDLSLATSAIGSLDGGDVTVKTDGKINLSQGSFVFNTSDCYGIYTSGHSDVNVTAGGDINIGSARIAAFNGGNVLVESHNGSVNAGIGVNLALSVYGFFINPNTGLPAYTEFGDLTDAASLDADPTPYGSGIIAILPTTKYLTPGGNPLPGNITVNTPKGNITSTQGGISQYVLNGVYGAGPTITLNAGTPGTPATADQGNVDLGNGGIIGGAINVAATGKVKGLIISKYDTLINAGQSFSGTVLSGGNVGFSGGGGVSGTVVGMGGISVQGGGPVTATLLSQSVSVGGAATTSTLATSSGATSTSQAAAQQSSTTTQQKLASNDDDDLNPKKKDAPVLMRHIKRVTVLLPKAI